MEVRSPDLWSRIEWSAFEWYVRSMDGELKEEHRETGTSPRGFEVFLVSSKYKMPVASLTGSGLECGLARVALVSPMVGAPAYDKAGA